MADAAEAWKPKFNPWLIAIVVAMAAFMEVLDTSIANVALPHLAGDLGASNDESTWVLTSYLVSNAVVLPMTGWLATTFGRKRLFLLCISLFTVTSLLCGVAPSLSMLVLFRVIQGAGGGGLQPMAQAILADTFPPEKRGLAFALYGITTIMASGSRARIQWAASSTAAAVPRSLGCSRTWGAGVSCRSSAAT